MSAEWALIDTQTLNLVRMTSQETGWVAPDLAQKNLKWAKVVRNERPVFDAATQRLVESQELQGSSYIISYTVENLSADEVTTLAQTTKAQAKRAVDQERDRRSQSGFSFGGKTYDFDESSRARISGAGVLALAAIVNGAQPGDLRWANADSDFAWIAQDNTTTTMDAQTCFAFGQAAAAHESAHIFAARTIKDMSPIPDDYADNQYWPAAST